jgi:hypothetical protein
MTEVKTVRIGGASGAWGDSPGAIEQLLDANVQYFMMDYLAEVTMSLLARARMKDTEAGYPPDFVGYTKRYLKQIAEKGIKIASNGGGVNPIAAKKALEAAITEAGLSLKVAVVEGDDVIPLTDQLRADGLKEYVSGEPLPKRLLTANAYLGALPIKAAFDGGADIVITGRCADSALALGILMHEFGWGPTEYDHLASGSLVGHILECGPQATGGNYTDWHTVPDWYNIGYPIAEVSADGSFIVSKPEGTGGLIIPSVVAEQTLYEIGDPAAYMLPDVVADFSHVTITEAGEHKVKVAGAKGRPPTSTYKVSSTYQDGYRAVASLSIVGPDAAAKADKTAEAIIKRAEMLFQRQGLPGFTDTLVEALGSEASYRGKSKARATREVLLRVAVSHPSRDALEIFARELGAMGLSTAPGLTGIYTGRPKPTPVVKLFTFFIEKSKLGKPRLTIADAAPVEIDVPFDGGYVPPLVNSVGSIDGIPGGPTVDIPLGKLAFARSGDKGDSANIAIFARKPALGGGGMASLRIDPQGKAYGQMTLEMLVKVPEVWAKDLAD